MGESGAELGRFVRRHDTDESARGRIALVAVGSGLVAVLLTVPLGAALSSSYGARPAGLRLVAGALLLLALVNAVRRLRWADEHVVVREGGLVHERAGRVRVIRWSEVTAVSGRGPAARIGAPLGLAARGRIGVRGGRALRVRASLTGGAELLAHVRRAARPGPGKR